MSEPDVDGSSSCWETLERSREEVLSAARPLPLDGSMVIEDLSDDEDLFLAAILDL